MSENLYQVPEDRIESNPNIAVDHNSDNQRSVPSWINKKTGLIACSALVIGAGLGLSNCRNGNELPVVPNATNTLQETIQKALTVNTLDANCATIVPHNYNIPTQFGNIIRYDVGALNPVGSGPSERKFSTALEPPIIPNNPQVAFKQVEKSICVDPLYGSTIANLFNNTTVDGVNVGQLNPILEPYKGNANVVPNNIALNATKFMPLGSNPEGNLKNAINENKDYQKLAETIITLLKHFELSGFGDYASILNYHLVAGGLVSEDGFLPEVSISPRVDRKTALILKVTDKNGVCHTILTMGFNVLDGRPELYANICNVNTPPTTYITPTTVPKNTPPTTYISPTTTVPHSTTTTTTIPYSTTTTTTPNTPPTTVFIGPKQNPEPPVGPSPSTTIGPNNPSNSTPTTETTLPPLETGTTVLANSSTSTTIAPSGCGSNCP